jgi:hypothetical protein
MNKIGNREFVFCLLFFLLQPLLSYFNVVGKFAATSIIFCLAFFFYAQNKQFRSIARSAPCFIWLILTIFHYANGLLKHVPEVDFVDCLHGLKIYACIVIFSFWATIDFKKSVTILLKTFLLYLIMSFFICDFSIGNTTRMSGIIYATQLGQTAALTASYVSLFFLSKKINWFKCCGLFAFCFLVILFSQSRNSLAMLVIVFVGFFIAQQYRKKHKFSLNFILLVAIFGVAALGVSSIIENSALGNRAHEIVDYYNSYSYRQIATGTIFDKIVGDRLFYYIEGWKCFLNHPITGIGIWNFMYYTHTEYVLHTEYMVHLCEGGLVAFLLWSAYYFLLIRYVVKSNTELYYKIMILASVVAILFCGIYAREFFYEFFYPIHGLALSLYFNSKLTRITKK